MNTDAATFPLDEPTPNDPAGPWDARRNARTRRFAYFGLGALLATGGAATLFYGASSPAWGLLLFAGLVLLICALYLWIRRPFLHLDGDGLTFRLYPGSSRHTVRWGELARVEIRSETGPSGVRLRREDEPTMHLAFDALSDEAACRLAKRLADTARHHGVPVYPS